MSSRRIDVARELDARPLSRVQGLIILLSGLVTLLDGYDQLSTAFVAPLLARALGLRISEFGSVFGINLLGLTLGAIIIGPCADRWGRKRTIVVSTFTFGLFSLLTAATHSLASLLIVRFLAGLALGAALPSVVALTSEYSPQRLRAFLVTGTFAGLPLGATLGGLISARIIPVWGWQSVFYLGGVAPMALAVVLALFLPESIRFMVAKGWPAARIAQAFRSVVPDFVAAPGDSFAITEAPLRGLSVRHLFADGRSATTLLLWVIFLMQMVMLFFLQNWLPTVMTRVGVPISKAIMVSVVFNVGGIIGAFTQGSLIERFGYYGVLSVASALAALFVATVGFLGAQLVSIMIIAFFAGACIIGALCGANALAAELYPTAIRATGSGFALATGRIGSIVGSVVGGILLGMHWEARGLFLAAAIPGLIVAMAVIVLAGVVRRFNATTSMAGAQATEGS